MSSFLLPPIAHCCLGWRPSDGLARTHHSRVLAVGYMINKKVIISRAVIHHLLESSCLEEEFFLVSQVATHAHVRVTVSGRAQVVQTIEERVIAHQTINKSLFVEIRTKTQHHLLRTSYIVHRTWFKSSHHLAYPMCGLWGAVCVCEQ